MFDPKERAREVIDQPRGTRGAAIESALTEAYRAGLERAVVVLGSVEVPANKRDTWHSHEWDCALIDAHNAIRAELEKVKE